MTVAAARELSKRRKATPTETVVPLLIQQCAALQLPSPSGTEYKFHPTRNWAMDLVWLDYKLAVEVDGGGWINGRHSRGYGIEEDSTKYAEAILRGWRIFRTTPRQVKRGLTLNWLERYFALAEKPTGAPKC